MRVRTVFLGCILAVTMVGSIAGGVILIEGARQRDLAVRMSVQVEVARHLLLAAEKLMAERGSTADVLLGRKDLSPTDQARIAAMRAVTDATVDESLRALVSAGAAAVRQSEIVRADRAAILAWRTRTDEMLTRPAAMRPPEAYVPFAEQIQPVMDSFEDAIGVGDVAALEHDTHVAELLELAHVAWHLRTTASRRGGPLFAAVGAGRPLAGPALEVLVAADAVIARDWSVIDGLARRVDSARLDAALAKAKQGYEESEVTYRKLVETGRTGSNYAVTVSDFGPRFARGASSAQQARDGALEEARAYTDRLYAAATRRLLLAAGGVLIILGVAIAAVVVVARRIVSPLVAMTGAIGAIAQRDYAVAIPAQGRADEVGSIAAALDTLRSNAMVADDLARERTAEQAQRQEHTATIEALIRDFETNATALIGELAGAAVALQGTARSLSSTAGQTGAQASAAAGAAHDATSNVQSVAAAADQLSASIAAIAARVAESARITQTAVTSAQRTDRVVQELAEGAQKIGNIVGLIASIAGQTNLLALNATIEAARAGEAGKGFAVVASEVKSLASQTARATDEIGAQVRQIQAATAEAVSAIGGIAGTIHEVGAIASSIAAAVEEQGAATGEIARNVQRAAAGTQTVTANISGVSQAAEAAASASAEVLGAATDLAGRSQRMSATIGAFVSGVRAA